MIFDVNAFIGKWPYWPLRAATAAEVAGELSGWGIDRAAICSTRSVFVHQEDGNRESEAAARALADRYVAFACLGPDRDLDCNGYAARGFRGIRLYPQHHSYHPLYEPHLDAMLEDAAARGWPCLLPLRILMNWGMPMLELAVMEAVVARHPRVRWILAGINYLWELQLAVSLMRRFPAVHLETSCIMGYRAIEKLVLELGDERLLFGSGAPLQHGAATLSKILHANISDAARERITGANACGLLRIVT